MFVLISISCVNASENNTLSNDINDLTATSATDTTDTTNNILTTDATDTTSNILTADTADAGNFTELFNLVQTEDEINLKKDYVAKQGDNFIFIEKNLKIDGEGHTIDAGGFTRVFRTPEDAEVNVTLKNLIIKNGFAKRGWGGAISFSSDSNVNFIINNCTFINNKADFGSGAIEFTPKKGTLEISDSTFIGNQAMHGTGGAIRDAAQKTTIINSKFENNTARGGDGGAVYISTDSNDQGVVIDNCTFNKNRVLRDEAGFNGGAVRAKTATLRITNSTFTDNHVTGRQEGSQKSIFGDMDGGAIESEGRLEIGGCYFKDNSAYDCGGAIAANTIVWLDKPCVFIHNHVETWNDIVANKGGAVYASRFENTAKGHIFINNSGYYGGAVYMRESGDVNFESCYFEGNVALTSNSKQGSGAAIYVDKSASKVSLTSNTFVDNRATSDSGIFNCGKYVTYTGNWWGTNSPNFGHEKYIVEWHRMQSNDVYTDSGYLQAVLRSDKTDLFGEGATLTLQIIDSQGNDFTGKLTNLNATFTAENGGVFTNKEIHDNKITVTFTPTAATDNVTAKINNQILNLSFTQLGNFTKLQQEINAANGVLNLTHDYTYSIGIDTMYEGILINKPIVINGNGHTINALDKTRIFLIQSDNVTINNVTFDRGLYSMGGGITIEGSDVKILNSKFTNNFGGQYGGAIFARSGNNTQIIGCQFINNTNFNEGGGAILVDTPNTIIEKSTFLNNTGTQGGALDLRQDNVTIKECEFRNNVAINEDRNGGGAINNFGNNVTIKNSLFLNNKARSTGIQGVNGENSLALTLTGKENYINAINSSTIITFSNVTYWDGAETTSNDPVRSMNESGQNITLEIFNSENKAVKKVTLTTNKNGQAVFNYDSLPTGNYTYTATHSDDSYYTACSYSGEFNVTRTSGLYPSEVKINIENKSEFKHGNCTIPFEVTNRTIVEVVITNSDFSQIFYDNETTLDNITVDLPASDEYYNIIVFNHGNSTYDTSSAEKSFKILKENSTVSIDPVSDVTYYDPVNIAFTGDGTSYNVTVYDKDNRIVFTQITDKNSVKISSALDVGKYNVTVINIGNKNRTSSNASTNFNVTKKDNHITVTVQDATYGEETDLTVYAEVEGQYKVYINSTEIKVDVYGTYNVKPLYLAAGNYTTSVTFDNPNYNNIIDCYNFTIRKAESNVVFSLGNVTHKQNFTVSLVDNFPTKYNVTLTDSGRNIKFHDIINTTEFTIPALDVGEYNLTVINMGNENITGSQYSDIFEVTTDNHVEIIIDDTEYDKELMIYLFANVDGYYTVDINGTELTIEVIDGFGYNNTLNLDVGDYYANVSFDNQDYNNIIENTTFTIYPADSKLTIEDIENVTYGEDVKIEYYDEFNATFDFVIFDENEDPVWEFRTNVMSVIVSDLAAGNYTLMVTNNGNENIIGVTEFKNFTVYKAESKLNIEDIKNVTYGENVNIKYSDKYNTTFDITILDKNQNTVQKYRTNKTSLTISDLAAGNYTLIVTNNGNNNITGATKSKNFTVYKAESKLNIEDIKNVTYGENVNIKYSDKYNTTFDITILDKNQNTVQKYRTNKTSLTISDLAAGNYTLIVTNNGNNNITGATKSKNFTVYKATPKMNVSGDSSEIIVNLPKNATGTVSTIINGNELSYPVVKGLAIIPLYDLKPGNYTFDIKYPGDKNYTAVTVKYPSGSKLEVPKINTTINTGKLTPSKVDDTTTVSGTLTDVNGKPIPNVEVTVKYANTTKVVKTDNNGKYTVTIPNIRAGTNNVTVTYVGSDTYNKVSYKTTQVVSKYDTKIKVDKVSGIVGEKITLTAYVTDINGKNISGGNLVFKLNGKTLREDYRFDSNATPLKFKVVNGKVTVTLTADLYLRNAKNLTASYSGSYKYEASKSEVVTAQIQKRRATLKVTTTQTKGKDNDVIFKVYVTDVTRDAKNKTSLSTDATVIFKVNGKTIKDKKGSQINVNVVNNTATYTYPVESGAASVYKNGSLRNYTVEAVYKNPSYYPDTRNSTIFHVEKSDVTIQFTKTTVKSNKLSVKATMIDAEGDYLVGNSTVAIKINGKTYQENGKNKYFNIVNGKVNLSGIKLAKGVNVRSVTIVTGERKSYNGARKTTTNITAS